MNHYLAELYLPRAGRDAFANAADRACAAAAQLAREGTPVRYVRSIFVPEDETCFLLFEAGSLDAVHAASDHAALECLRIVEAIQGTRRRPITRGETDDPSQS
jgi:hypothetical protein